MDQHRPHHNQHFTYFTYSYLGMWNKAMLSDVARLSIMIRDLIPACI